MVFTVPSVVSSEFTHHWNCINSACCLSPFSTVSADLPEDNAVGATEGDHAGSGEALVHHGKISCVGLEFVMYTFRCRTVYCGNILYANNLLCCTHWRGASASWEDTMCLVRICNVHF